VSFFGFALDVCVATAQEQAARGAYSGADHAEIGRGVEQARVPLPPAGQQPVDLITQTHDA
jgi:hypothetical protein